MMELKRLKRELLYSGKVFDLIVDEIEYPSGRRGVREIAHHPGGAVVVPVLDDGRIVMVRQLRYPLEKHILELPAGKLSPGEAPEHAARRELEEETGWVAGRLTKLISIYTTPGFCDEELHLYLGTGLHPAPDGHKREEGESSMTIHLFALNDALRMIETGEIKDSKTIVGLLLAEKHLRRHAHE